MFNHIDLKQKEELAETENWQSHHIMYQPG